MDTQVTTSHLEELIQDGADVLTTVFDFGRAEIKRSSKANLTLFAIHGTYTPHLGKEIEKLAMQCRGNVGLEFREMTANQATGRKFDSSIVPVLKRIHERFAKRNRLFLLCFPPTDLIDLLKLTGAYNELRIVNPSSGEDGQAIFNSALEQSDESERAVESDIADDAIRKRIVHLNQSLERTISLEKGLDSAEKCVMRFLPRSAPNTPGYEFAFSYQSSEKVGGDFFDFIPLGSEHIGISIGDVSGHGIHAALLMGISKKVVRIRALDAGTGSAPKDVLVRANADLASDFSRTNFVTVLYGILHLPTGRFDYARAGHEPPFFCGPRKGNVIVQESNGSPLGINVGSMLERSLETKAVKVPNGGFVFLCTDGLAECWNKRGATYSRERLVFALEQIDHQMSCEDALESVLRDISAFSEGRPQEDDMTTIMLKRCSG